MAGQLRIRNRLKNLCLILSSHLLIPVYLSKYILCLIKKFTPRYKFTPPYPCTSVKYIMPPLYPNHDGSILPPSFFSYTAFVLLSAFNEIPSTRELQHINQLGDNPPPPQILQIREKTQALVYIGGGLPPIPARLVKRIEDGQFVEMAELLLDHLSSSPYTDEDQAKSTKVKYKEVLDIEWLQCFSLYIAVIARSNASCVVDLLGYQNLIVQSQLKYQDGCWAVYDWQFSQKASAISVPEWSVIDTTLWNLAFAGQGTSPLSNHKGQYRATFHTMTS